MAKVFIDETTLTDIGNAIRKKIGDSNLINTTDMASTIESISLPIEAFNITGDCSYRFSSNNWNWFLDMYKDYLHSEDITIAERMFHLCGTLKEVPFKLNFKNQEGINASTMFYACTSMEKLPVLNIPNAKKLNLYSFLQNCAKVKDLNGLFENEEEFGASWQSYVNTAAYGNHYLGYLFHTCGSLRTIPTWFYLLRLNPESTQYPAAGQYSLYARAFSSCYVLDEVKDIPVWKCKGTATANMFGYSTENMHRLKDFTFETNADGSPIVTEWKSQVIDLSYLVGYCNSSYSVTGYGITADKEVKNDDTYQALKNDPDWFSTKLEYCRYNHDSAVNTINSLPDTSAFGTNTIKFKGTAGSKTDGGAINTLTEEEIAVATAKGWTVTFA